MPIYEYVCPKCKAIQEELKLIEDRDAKLICPACGVPMKRQYASSFLVELVPPAPPLTGWQKRMF